MRFLEYKMGSLTSESAVIRARYEPDVRGVNRPIVQDNNYYDSNSIDKKRRNGSQRIKSKSPRLPSALTKLPPINHDCNSLATSPTVSSSEEGRTTLVHSSTVTDGYRSPLSPSLPQINPKTSTPKANGGFGISGKQKNSNRNQQQRNGRPPTTGHGIPVIVIKQEACPRRSRSMNSLRNVNGNTNKNVKKKTNPTKSRSTTFTNPTINSQNKTVTKVNVNKIETPISIATQTEEEYPLPLKPTKTNQELKQQKQLLEIIDGALSEAIDHDSRLKANKYIAEHAQKQGDALRHAKDFVLEVLIPESIMLANRARTKKSPLESIASIQLP